MLVVVLHYHTSYVVAVVGANLFAVPKIRLNEDHSRTVEAVLAESRRHEAPHSTLGGVDPPPHPSAPGEKHKT